MFAAIALPFIVPGIITALIWALPGDPASIICPPGQCPTEILKEEFNLDKGAWYFFLSWLGDALQGDFGTSWRVMTGVDVYELMMGSPADNQLVEPISAHLPNTVLLLTLSLLPITIGAALGAMNKPTPKWDPILVSVGIIPIVVLSLLVAALVEINIDLDAETTAGRIKILAGALTLGIADAALSGSIIGVRGIFDRENKQRYVGVSILRGETVLSNTLPNVANSLVGQYRSRILHLLSGLVIVETIIGIDGIGRLLWKGTLKQDFGVVLATATAFAIISALLLLLQALLEAGIALHIRKAPKGVALTAEQK